MSSENQEPSNDNSKRWSWERLQTMGCGCLLLIVLVVWSLPVFMVPRGGHSPRIYCVNNQKNIAMALQNYEAAKKKFPPAYVVDSEGKPLYSWRVLILPFIEEGNMYREFHLDEPWDSPHNLQFLEHCPSYFQCPASNLSREKGETTYAMIVGPDAVSNGSESVGMDFIASTPQGASGTLLITESRIPVPWTAPYDIPLESLRDGISPRVAPSKDKQGVGAPHNSNAVAAFVDGSVRYLDPSTTTPEQLWKLATIGTSEEKPSP